MHKRQEALLLDEYGERREHLGGFETEYPFEFLDAEDRAVYPHDSSQFGKYVFSSTNQFDKNQDRLYLDHGLAEGATAEDTDFLRIAKRSVLVGLKLARTLNDACTQVQEKGVASPNHQLSHKLINDLQHGDVRLVMHANTTSEGERSRGNHLNLLLPREIDKDNYYAAQIAHRVSRIVWSGAGMVQGDGSGSFQYCLSERAQVILDVYGENTTKYRTIINLRDQPLADRTKFRRDHDIAGETVLNIHTNALRFATSAIIAAAVELGEDFTDIELDDPVGAMRQISSDLELKNKVRLKHAISKNGHRVVSLTGLELQDLIHERCMQAAKRSDYFTAQEHEWLNHWKKQLDSLAKDPMSTRLDWAVKRHVIDAMLSRPHPGLSDYRVAYDTALNYSRLLPSYGPGVQLLLRGAMGETLTESEIEHGMPLPPTRAKLRDKVITQVHEMGGGRPLQVMCGEEWEAVYVHLDRRWPKSMLCARMPDPYDSEGDAEKLEQFYGEIRLMLGTGDHSVCR